MPSNTVRLQGRYLRAEQIGGGSTSIVYRAIDRLTNTSLALKQPICFGDERDEIYRAALIHEYKLLATLQHPHLVRTLDIIPGKVPNEPPSLVMEFLPNAVAVTMATINQPLHTRLMFFQQLLSVVDYLHRCGVLHRDLKPSNILVSNRHIKLIDLGFAAEIQEAVGVTGTVRYLAPEIVRGEPATPASDLYSTGVIATEIFGDCLLPSPLYELITQLQHGNAKRRPQHASDVLEALTNIITDVPMPYPRSIPLIGRESQSMQLSAGLTQAQDGAGSLWLVGGESGIGKTRLLQELSGLARCREILVLEGGAANTPGHPYEALYAPLRHLALVGNIDDEQAGVLQELVPDLEQLLERTIPPVVQLESAFAQARLQQAIVHVLLHQTSPILLLIDDLQWAYQLLPLLNQLSRSIGAARLMIVGAFRSDEATELPQQLPNAQILRLERLSHVAIARMGSLLLGNVGEQPLLVNYLEHETMGNAFYLMEAFRTLSGQAGIGSLEHIVIPSISIALSQRLKRLSTRAAELLKIIATLGKVIDERIYTTLDIEGKARLEWLAIGVIEFSNGMHQFVHDKYREAVLEGITNAESTAIYERAASVLEQVYASGEDHAELLALLWGKARNEQKEAHYCRIAARRLIVTNNLPHGLVLAQRALDILVGDDYPTSIQQRLELHLMRLDAFRDSGDLPRAIDEGEIALALALEVGSQDDIATALTLLGASLYLSGQFDSAVPLLEQAVALWKATGNDAKAGEALSVLGEAIGMYRGYTLGTAYLEEAVQLLRPSAQYVSLASALRRLAINYQQSSQFRKAVPLYDETAPIFRQVHDLRSLAKMLNSLSMLNWSLGNIHQALTAAREGLQIAIKQELLASEYFSYYALGLAAYAEGDLEQARAYQEQSAKGFHALANYRSEIYAHIVLWRIEFVQGNFEASRKIAEKAIQDAITHHIQPVLVESVAILVWTLLAAQQIDKISDAFAYAAGVDAAQDSAEYLLARVAATLYDSMQGERDAALITHALSAAKQLTLPTQEGFEQLYMGGALFSALALLSEGEVRQECMDAAKDAYRRAARIYTGRGIIREQRLYLDLITARDNEGVLDLTIFH
jgi:eukaryotic-like serine/threonine-protein kinase